MKQTKQTRRKTMKMVTKIAVLASLNIADELFSYKKKHNKILNKLQSESELIIESIEEKIK